MAVKEEMMPKYPEELGEQPGQIRELLAALPLLGLSRSPQRVPIDERQMAWAHGAGCRKGTLGQIRRKS